MKITHVKKNYARFLGVLHLNTKQEQKRKPTTTNVGIKRKVGTLVVEALQSHVMEGTSISKNIEGNMEEPIHKQPRVGHVSELVEKVV